MAGRLQLSVVDLLVDFKRNGLNPPCQMVKGAIKQTVNVQTPEDFLCCSFGSPGSPHGEPHRVPLACCRTCNCSKTSKPLRSGECPVWEKSVKSFTGPTISTLLHDRINPKDCQVLSLGDTGFLQFFRVDSSDYGKPWVSLGPSIKRSAFLGFLKYQSFGYETMGRRCGWCWLTPGCTVWLFFSWGTFF